MTEASNIDFSTFLLSLYHNAISNLGERVSNEIPAQVHLPMARHFIDLIKMLEAKTAGNLTKQEAELIKKLLSELQFKFVQVQNQQS